jgi:hypothetical protein
LAENPPTIATPGERPTTFVSPAGPLQRTGELLLSHVTEKRFITLLLVLFIAKGVIITFAHAPYSGHDEVAHYAYLQVVAEEGRIPELPDLEEWRASMSTTGCPRFSGSTAGAPRLTGALGAATTSARSTR